jgi:hypothetical protein
VQRHDEVDCMGIIEENRRERKRVGESAGAVLGWSWRFHSKVKAELGLSIPVVAADVLQSH